MMLMAVFAIGDRSKYVSVERFTSNSSCFPRIGTLCRRNRVGVEMRDRNGCSHVVFK